jgi:hypothetical protein
MGGRRKRQKAWDRRKEEETGGMGWDGRKEEATGGMGQEEGDMHSQNYSLLIHAQPDSDQGPCTCRVEDRHREQALPNK